LRRALGYSLTRTTEARAVFVACGSGNNGKTTLLATFLQLLERVRGAASSGHADGPAEGQRSRGVDLRIAS